MHSSNGGEDAIRCPTAGQFGSKALALCRAVALAEVEPIYFCEYLTLASSLAFLLKGFRL